ncbi:hypothetical protein [Streptomyces sp. NPDC059862]
MVGCVSGELDLRPFLERQKLVVTSDKEGPTPCWTANSPTSMW